MQGEITRITDDLLITAAKTLAESVSAKQIAQGCLYPPLTEIRQVSLQIAVAVAQTAARVGLTQKVIGKSFAQDVAAAMYDPRY